MKLVFELRDISELQTGDPVVLGLEGRPFQQNAEFVTRHGDDYARVIVDGKQTLVVPNYSIQLPAVVPVYR